MTQNFAGWRKTVQSEMEGILLSHLPAATQVPERLHEAMQYAVLDGGKRVRPLLVFAAGELFDAPRDAIARAAAAVEMIHAYSLVHDDMPCMDDDDLRRGKPTVHKQYDEATALLVGDALQAQAFDVLAGGTLDAARKVSMLSCLARAAGSLGMCGGQAIDLASVGLALTREQLEQMHRLKTGALLEASVMLGALAGKSLQDIIGQLGHVAEGVRCVSAVKTLAIRHGLDMPIVEAVARVLFDAEAPAKAIDQLLAREARAEH